MFPEPFQFEQLSGKIWPDRLLFFPNIETMKTEIYFVYDRGNNRAVTPEKAIAIRTLEAAGLPVFLSFNGNLMTLDEFNAGGGYKTKVNAAASRPYYYHLLNECKHLETNIDAMPDGPAKDQAKQVLSNKKAALDVISAKFGNQQKETDLVVNVPWGTRLNRVTKFYQNAGRSLEEIRPYLKDMWRMQEQGLDGDQIEQQVTNPRYIPGKGILNEIEYMEHLVAEENQNASERAS